MSNISKTSKCTAAVVIFVNIVSLTLSLSTFAASLWIIVSPSTLAQALRSTGISSLKVLFPEESLTLPLGIGLSLLSMFVLCVSLMGLYGAVSTSPFLLFMYSALVLLLMLLECSLFFYFTSNIAEKGVEGTEQFDHILRLSLRCCDYNDTRLNPLPWSCCGVIANNCTPERVFIRSCKTTMSAWLHHYGTIVYGSIVTSHVILSSCALLRRASSASRSHT